MTLLYLYYNQPEALTFYTRLGYPKLPYEIVFVDDGSKEPLKLDWATVLRIDKDTPWNMPFANNMGLWYIYLKNPNAKVLRTDIDHYFAPEDIEIINELEVKKNHIIKFKRGHLLPHHNTFLMNVSDLLEAGGYNVDYCGNYGYDDKELMDRLKRKGFAFELSEIQVRVNHSLKSVGERDTSVNYLKYEKSNS